MMTYDYSTRKIVRDFKVRRHGEKCLLSGLPAKVGNHRCQNCQHNKGGYFNWQSYDLDDTFFTYCNHQEAKDSENIDTILYRIYDKFEQEALAHMYD